MRPTGAIAVTFGVGCFAASAQEPSTPVPVTVENFVRAETDKVFSGFRENGFSKFEHFRTLAPVDRQIVQRGNRDTLYSIGVFDLDAGPVTMTLPNAGKRFMSLLVIDEDHYVVGVYYGAGTHTFTRKQVGTRYVQCNIRLLVNPNDAKDLAAVRALQDAVVVKQSNPGKLEVPNWDVASHKTIRDALTTLGATLPDWNRAAGRRGEVDPIRHLIVTATGWGLNPQQDAVYLNVTPARNDGKTVHKLTVKSGVPVDGFWSISLYNADGYFVKNAADAYTINSITGKRDADGSIVIQFGDCDCKVPNCLPIMQGWNYMVRLYRPRSEILNGNWKFPEAQPL